MFGPSCLFQCFSAALKLGASSRCTCLCHFEAESKTRFVKRCPLSNDHAPMLIIILVHEINNLQMADEIPCGCH